MVNHTSSAAAAQALPASTRGLAMSTLCTLAHGSPRTLEELRAKGVADTMLALLREEVGCHIGACARVQGWQHVQKRSAGWHLCMKRLCVLERLRRLPCPARKNPLQAYQEPVLEALAAWLDADTARLEHRLLEPAAVTRLVSLLPTIATAGGRARRAGALGAASLIAAGPFGCLASCTHRLLSLPSPTLVSPTRWSLCAYCCPGDFEALSRLLAPLLRLMGRSPRLCVALAQNGLAPRVMDLLKKPHAATCLSLLAMLRAMYEHHPAPKVGAGGREAWRVGRRARASLHSAAWLTGVLRPHPALSCLAALFLPCPPTFNPRPPARPVRRSS